MTADAKAPKMGADDYVEDGHSKTDLEGLTRADVAEAPAVERLGDDFTLTWVPDRLTIRVTSLREHSDGIKGLVSVSLDGQELHWGTVNLVSTAARIAIAKDLKQQHNKLPWRQLLDRACRLVTEEMRRPEPTVLLTPRPLIGPRALVDPFLPLHETTVFFGDGGTGKGYLALLLVAAIATSIPLPGAYGAAKRVPILYLDWETNREPLEDRCYRLGHGLGVDLAGALHYKRMVRPLIDELPAIRAEVSRLNIGFLIADSLGPACGFEAEGTGAAIQAMNALRACGPTVTRLALAHVSKAMADNVRIAARPFGSVFVQNLARSTWEIRGVQEGHTLTSVLYDRKENDAPKRLAPIAFRFSFGPGHISVDSGDLDDAPDLRRGASLGFQILSILAGGPKTTGEMVKDLKNTAETIGRTCRRLVKADKMIRLEDVKTGRGHETRWALKADT